MVRVLHLFFVPLLISLVTPLATFRCKAYFWEAAPGLNYCYFPMPFDKSANIEFIRRNSKHVSGVTFKIKTEIWYTENKRSPDTEGRFYTQWRKNPEIQVRPASYICRYKRKGPLCGYTASGTGAEGRNDDFFRR